LSTYLLNKSLFQLFAQIGPYCYYFVLKKLTYWCDFSYMVFVQIIMSLCGFGIVAPGLSTIMGVYFTLFKRILQLKRAIQLAQELAVILFTST